jgi:hypothetical protein
MIQVGLMILSEPSIIIIWTYPDMMEWMSRILVREMAVADEDFGGCWANVADFCSLPKPLIQLSMIHVGQMILSEPSIIIIWTYPDMMEWMSRILVVREMAVADEDFGSDVGQMWLISVPCPNC